MLKPFLLCALWGIFCQNVSSSVDSNGTLVCQLWCHSFLVVHRIYPGWGLLSQFAPFRYFPHFPLLSKQTLAIEYHVHIWQVSPQLSCDDTCQIWMWFRESNRYFCKIENFAYGEISEQSFSNPHPRNATFAPFTKAKLCQNEEKQQSVTNT